MWQVVLGGTIALAGVLLAEWIRANGDRWDRVRANTTALAYGLPIFTAYYSDDPNSADPDNDLFGQYWTHRQDMLKTLGDMRWLPRWPMRNAKEIKQNARLLLTMMVAMESRHQNGMPLTRKEQFAISWQNRLHELVFKTTPASDEELKRYEAEGFPMPEDDGD